MSRAQNAPRPLALAMDGTRQLVHPDVLRISRRPGGYEYWMTCTPYPSGDDRRENPCVRVSHDGYTWAAVSGLPDSLIPPPPTAAAHHADGELVDDGERIHLIYMTRDKAADHTTFSVISTVNGTHWTEPVPFYEGRLGVSPTATVDGGCWSLWSVHHDTVRSGAPAAVLLRTGPSLLALGEPVECSVAIPRFIPWHIDALKTEAGWEFLVAAYPVGTDMGRCSLFHLVSRDGLTLELDPPSPLLRPSRLGWDNRMIYRSTMLRAPDGRIRLWYSGASWGWTFGIGYLEGPLAALAADSRCEEAPVEALFRRLFRDGKGYAKYHLRRQTPRVLLAALRQLRHRPGPGSAQA